MNIQKLVQDFRDHYQQYHSESHKKTTKSPDYLQEVISPVLKALSQALPKYEIKMPSRIYSLLTNVYPVKGRHFTYGLFIRDENFELYFTPSKRAPIMKPIHLQTLDQLVEIIQSIYPKKISKHR